MFDFNKLNFGFHSSDMKKDQIGIPFKGSESGALSEAGAGGPASSRAVPGSPRDESGLACSDDGPVIVTQKELVLLSLFLWYQVKTTHLKT